MCCEFKRLWTSWSSWILIDRPNKVIKSLEALDNLIPERSSVSLSEVNLSLPNWGWEKLTFTSECEVHNICVMGGGGGEVKNFERKTLEYSLFWLPTNSKLLQPGKQYKYKVKECPQDDCGVEVCLLQCVHGPHGSDFTITINFYFSLLTYLVNNTRLIWRYIKTVCQHAITS